MFKRTTAALIALIIIGLILSDLVYLNSQHFLWSTPKAKPVATVANPQMIEDYSQGIVLNEGITVLHDETRGITHTILIKDGQVSMTSTPDGFLFIDPQAYTK